MGSEAIGGAVATNRDVERSKPGPFQDCRDVVRLNLFFDGTGNNLAEDGGEKKKWSNVGRLFSAMDQDIEKGVYKIYISGVGTPYNGKAVKWLSSTGVWLQDNIGGLGSGSGGTRRLEHMPLYTSLIRSASI